MELSRIYPFSYDYLVEIAKGVVTKDEIDAFICEADIKFTSIEGAFELLLSILQDFQRLPNVINYAKRKAAIHEMIHFPDISYCAGLDPEELAESFIERFQAKGVRSWRNYAKGIVEGAQFLNGFDSYEDMKAAFDAHDQTATGRESLALLLASTITNMGFAIACNWLKELGYVNYSKPDTHMKDICLALGLIEKKDDNIGCFRAMSKVAEAAGVDPYRLDKVWWLICSGNFYRYGKQLPNARGNKEAFLNALRKG